MAKLGNKTWWNGELIDTDSAKIHISAHTLHYGVGAFEGIRAYKTEDGKTSIFRCDDHMKRFVETSKIAGLPTPYNAETLTEACQKSVAASGFDSCYLRPIGFLDAGPLGVAFKRETHPYVVAILTMAWGKYLGDDAAQKGAKIKISSYNRHHPNVAMTKAKMCGQYTNSVLAKNEAISLGYDEALLLDTDGYVAEGSGENLFAVKNGKAFTPSVESVLSGITRDTVASILDDMGLELLERRMSRDELYCADELFFCGTAAEITPIGSLDDREIGRGRPGEVSQEVSKRFFDIVEGRNEKYISWLCIV